MTTKTKPSRTKIPLRPMPAKEPRTALAALRKMAGLCRKDLARLLSFSERAISEWEAGKPLSEPARRKIAETRRLLTALATLVDADAIPTWLQAPNDAFGGLKPLEIVERGEIDRLWRMVFFLESGVPT
jgi:transcriptional regulator with XRE-family HTH domain